MDLQSFVESIEAMASIYAFDILPDGSFSEIRLMAVNKQFSGLFSLNPKAPPFKPGMPYKYFFHDVNFESFCYKCASTKEPLYSYVNAHGVWLSGLYFAVESDIENTVYCCYILKFTRELESDVMSNRSSEIMSSVLNVSINLHKTQNFERSISETAREIKRICGSELCSILLVDKSEKECRLYTEEGIHQDYLEEIANDMNRTPYETALAWEKDLAGTDCFLLNDLSIVKERDELWYNSLISKNVKSIVLYAVNFNRELVGFIWAANFNVDNIMRIKETLELTAFFIGSFIANHQLVSRLEVMSMADMLTGLRNRNAMNKRIDKLLYDKPQCFGVVYADINGLKIVNDVKGHYAGDKLLIKAAELLKKAFGEYEIYRAGGDEFVVFCPDITENELEKLTFKLRKLEADTNEVSFAIGAVFFTGDYDINNVMQKADEHMYADKEEYYRIHPEKKYHFMHEKG